MIFVPAALFAQTTPAPLPAQQAAAPAAPAWSPSKDIGVFVFGRNSQTPDQQLKDESECYAAAKQQSGIDPKAPPAAAKSAEQKQAEQKEASAKVAAEQKAEEDRARLAHAEGLDTFQRAFGACMDARNYSVK